MGARIAFFVTAMAAISGCEPVASTTTFGVTFSFPADNAEAFPETPVRLGFSAAIDRDACEQAISLFAMGENGDVAWTIPFELTASEDTNTWELVHDEVLATDLAHGITVRTGSEGCTSARGLEIDPFDAVFRVVER